MELWKDIVGYEGYYQVSNYGRVKSLRKNKILNQRNRSLYLAVSICFNGVNKSYNVHRLVAIAFLPNINSLPQVNHKDENKKNNHVSNLEWCSAKYNNRYSKALLTEDDVASIRELRTQGYKLKEIADIYNINFRHVSNIVNYKRWL